MNIEIDALLQGGSSQAKPFISRLKYARFSPTSEVPEGKRANESLLKQMSGGDELAVRDMYDKPIDYTPTFKIWFQGQYCPSSRDNSLGWLRRVRILPFSVTIPLKNKESSLLSKQNTWQKKKAYWLG